jgi:hypothetical protein
VPAAVVVVSEDFIQQPEFTGGCHESRSAFNALEIPGRSTKSGKFRDFFVGRILTSGWDKGVLERIWAAFSST